MNDNYNDMSATKHRGKRVTMWTAALAAALLAERAAGQNDDGPGLLGLTFATPIEQAAARANDLVFRTLEPECNPSGVLDTLPSPEFGDAAGAGNLGPLCNPDAFHVYANARELAHTANELQGLGPTVASLGLDLEGLGRALRWTAAEELAAQGAMATQFANGQLATLAARLTALRFGPSVVGTTTFHDRLRRSSPLFAQAGEPEPADPDAPRETFSPWGGFLNYGFGYGTKTPTPLEDAFDFDGSEITLGIDYRLRNNVVLGGILGWTRQDIDFDEAASPISVVDGSIDAKGKSFIVFALAQGERLTVSGSLGVQSLDYGVDRHIQYPSFNPDIESTNSLARSEPRSDIETATFGLGYAFTWTRLTLEPYYSLEHLDITVDAFAEERSIERFSNREDTHRFELSVSGQDVKSLKSTIGVRFQYVVTPRLGFIVPFWTVAAHREHEDRSRTITSGYAVLADVLGSQTFELPTDAPPQHYYTVSAGFSMLLRGGRPRRADGPVAGGISGFVQLTAVRDRAPYDDSVLTAGLRYEF
ncbi:MAG TPA: autotransporter outer membrane beta-barrel domain-containing protein [Gammaproteobacteria bacterium]